MTEAIARGVTFYKDKKEHFVNPNLNLVPVRDARISSRLGIDSYTAQAITSGDEP
jgi:hypothetical protein